MSDTIGVGTLGETPECNGRCGENNHGGTDFFDVDRECPIHGDSADLREVCPEGCGLVEIADQSIETSGYEERQRDYHVTWLTCGHEIAV